MDGSLRSVEALQQELQRYGTKPILGSLPKLNQPQAQTLSLIQAGQCREALDLVYKNIEFLRRKSLLKSLVITSAVDGEGKSLVALGLALSAARAHQRVLLIDANLRLPSLHQPFQVANVEGLSMALASGDLPMPLGLSWGNVQFDLLMAGPVVPDPIRLLSSSRMQDLLHHYEAHYDLVLLDTPPLLGRVDALQAASCCDGVVLVARLNQVTRQDLSQAAVLLQPLNLVGLVVNGASAKPSTPAVEIPVQVHQLVELSEIRADLQPDIRLKNPTHSRAASGARNGAIYPDADL
jgi:polysaccharide biosynthesis transport protein